MSTSRFAFLPFALVTVSMLAVAGCGGTTKTDGASIFMNSGCGVCHTLTAANARGKSARNLDQSKFTEAQMVTQITNGGKVMQPFKGRLTTQQIATVAAYVAKSRDEVAAGKQ